MAASFFAIREEDQNPIMNHQQHFLAPPSSTVPPAAAPPQKRRRNQPGTPNPDAEVIALSPTTLMATNRFICEVCQKGFQREQNLQLHRRGHNLPWKLKQKSNKEAKKKVYLCPEISCVHHDPSRALGDLTGIKKHYSRKHGEKRWKCDKCQKKYAVQSDCKAHSKTCGTREYRCDCGTLFSRRDSFVTHRAFCDALAQENVARQQLQQQQPGNLTGASTNQLFGNTNNTCLGLSQMPPHISSLNDQNDNNSSTELLRFGNATRTGQFNHILSPQQTALTSPFKPPQQTTLTNHTPSFIIQDPNPNQNYHHDPHQGFVVSNKAFLLDQISSNNSPSGSNIFNLPLLQIRGNNSNNFSENFNNEGSIFFTEGGIMCDQQTSPISISPHMSATALLQKAAQMGASSSTNSSNNNNTASSLLRSFGDHKPFSSAVNYCNGLNMHEHLMNSFAANGNGNGNSSSPIFEGGSSTSSAAGFVGFEAYHDNGIEKEQKMNDRMGIGGSDGLTRDFLGVGQIVRGMSSGGGVSQKEQQRSFNLGSFDAEKNNAAILGQTFGGNFQ